MAGNYGLDELFRDLTGIGGTPAPSPAPPPSRPRTPAPTPAPTQAAPATKPSATARSAPTPAVSPSRNNPYDTVLGYGKFGTPSKPLTQGTIGEAVAFGRNVLIPRSRAAGVGRDSRGTIGSSAMGAYQITQETLQTYAPKVLGEHWRQAKFDSATQDKLARAIFEDSKAGNLRSVWAGLPDATPGAYAGKSWEEMKGLIMGHEGTSGKTPNGSTAGGNGVTPRANIDQWLTSAVPDEVKASSGVGLPEGSAEVIAAAPGVIAEKQAAVDSTLGDTATRLNVLDAATQASQQQQIVSKTQQVQDSRRINEEIIGATDQLKRQVQPIFEARARVADQLDKLATMNPLERGIKGIFDLNYDNDYLEGQMASLESTLKSRMYDYQYLDTLQGVALRELDRRYGIDTALTDLDVKQGTEDYALVNQRLGLASQMLDSSRGKLADQSQLIVAQAQARENILGRLDTPTTMELMTQAQANGGVTTFGGVDFSYKELRDRALLGEQQARTIRSQQMALAQGEMNLAQGLASDLTASLTQSQLEEAAANGGVYQGVQLPQDAITAGLENYRQRAVGQAQDILMRLPATTALNTARDSINATTALYYRSKPMLSRGDLQNSATQLTQMAELQNQISAAVDNGSPPAVIQAILGKISESQQSYQKMVSNSILRSVGGDKQAAGYVESFVYGSQMNPGTSAEALTYFALKGGLPDGLAVSPEARQVFVRAQKIAAEVRAKDPKIPFDRLKAAVQEGITDYAAQMVGTPRLNDILSSLPTQAKALGNPLGRLTNEWWRKTYTDANTYAAQDIANTIKTTPQNVATMMERMEPIDSSEPSRKLFQDFLAQAGKFNALEQQYLLDKLDSISPLVPGKSNSETFEDFLYSPELHQRVQKTGEKIEGNSFGDFLLGPMIQGAAQTALLDYASSLAKAGSAARVSHITAARNASQGWGYSPRARFDTILRTIPQVGDAGAEKLAPWLNQVMPPKREAELIAASPAVGVLPVMGQAGAEGASRVGEAQILDALRRTKFDDPSTEAYRKAAIQHWSEFSQLGDAVINNFTKSVKR